MYMFFETFKAKLYVKSFGMVEASPLMFNYHLTSTYLVFINQIIVWHTGVATRYNSSVECILVTPMK